MNREYKSVHDAHCCKIHGCKYGDDYCPVFNGDEDGVQCETCYWEANDPDTIELKFVKQQRDDLLAALKILVKRAEEEIADPEDVWEIFGAKQAIEKAEGFQG